MARGTETPPGEDRRRGSRRRGADRVISPVLRQAAWGHLWIRRGRGGAPQARPGQADHGHATGRAKGHLGRPLGISPRHPAGVHGLGRGQGPCGHPSHAPPFKGPAATPAAPLGSPFWSTRRVCGSVSGAPLFCALVGFTGGRGSRGGIVVFVFELHGRFRHPRASRRWHAGAQGTDDSPAHGHDAPFRRSTPWPPTHGHAPPRCPWVRYAPSRRPRVRYAASDAHGHATPHRERCASSRGSCPTSARRRPTRWSRSTSSRHRRPADGLTTWERRWQAASTCRPE
mmetsp:Transcript_29762/g.86717  ORF Transcript_29762/g.86717 Transcript_29762/m.86717 type:complete len:285 (-) Transcript_29762:455-1309(-)